MQQQYIQIWYQQFQNQKIKADQKYHTNIDDEVYVVGITKEIYQRPIEEEKGLIVSIHRGDDKYFCKIPSTSKEKQIISTTTSFEFPIPKSYYDDGASIVDLMYVSKDYRTTYSTSREQISYRNKSTLIQWYNDWCLSDHRKDFVAVLPYPISESYSLESIEQVKNIRFTFYGAISGQGVSVLKKKKN